MGKEYDIAKISGVCQACSRQLEPREEFIASVREADEQLLREDFCVSCWEADGGREGPHVLAAWRGRVPQPQKKRKLFVDDELLINFFERLADAAEPAKVAFRYVLALVLMRKKLLVYDRMVKADDGREIWQMHLKGSGDPHEVVDPKLTDDGIADVSHQLGEIIEGEL